MSSDQFKYLENQFNEYINKIYGGITLPDNQYKELKQTFFAGAKTTLDFICAVSFAAPENELGEISAASAIDDIDKEINDTINKMA